MTYRKVYQATKLCKTLDFTREDSGQAVICEIIDENDDEEEGLFIRLHSWSGAKEHPLMDSLIGKRVRVIVEVEVDFDQLGTNGIGCPSCGEELYDISDNLEDGYICKGCGYTGHGV